MIKTVLCIKRKYLEATTKDIEYRIHAWNKHMECKHLNKLMSLWTKEKNQESVLAS